MWWRALSDIDYAQMTFVLGAVACRRLFSRCAGTIRSCQKFLIKHGRKQIARLLTLCQTDDERAQVKACLESLPSSLPER